MRALFLLTVLLAAVPAHAQPDPAPLAPGTTIGWAHAPYEMGECSLCHQGNDPQDPGPLTAAVNDLCRSCHEMFFAELAGFANVHGPVGDSCTSCHNPHNSLLPKLLNDGTVQLCAHCHQEITAGALHDPVRHSAVTEGAACLNCHNPHATNVAPMLKGLPYDLCVDCHGQDGMVDEQGRPLTNLKKLIEGSHMLHGPVENKDCSGCHTTHSGANFRMLTDAYPAEFYAPYDARNYELCFTCHEIDVFEQPVTRTLTGFRHGEQNLHYVHVNKELRGRTCRACHEVHAAPQEHMVRDGVPYGSSGWVLKINYTRTETGGSCAKTCHPTKPYDRLAAVR